MNKKILNCIGVAGAVVCFIGDMLLGCFDPVEKSGVFLLFPAFSNEWANANPFRFVIGGLLGVIALMMFFAGFYAYYLQLKEKNKTLAAVFLAGSFVFVCVGTLYHCVFAISEWTFCKLSVQSMELAASVSREMFMVFISIAGFAAIGFAVLSAVMFIAALKKYFGSKLWCLVNPLILMMLFITLAMILPKIALFTGIFDWGQQSLALLICFSFFSRKYCEI